MRRISPYPQDEGVDIVRHQLTLDEVDEVVDPLR
jgi:hypothetical protein